jgi:hypothetical protein
LLFDLWHNSIFASADGPTVARYGARRWPLHLPTKLRAAHHRIVVIEAKAEAVAIAQRQLPERGPIAVSVKDGFAGMTAIAVVIQ